MRFNFLIGFIFGFIIWAAAPLLLGVVEPWDASWYGLLVFFISLFVAGFISCLGGRWNGFRNSIATMAIANLGVFLGQFIYAAIFLPGSAMWIIGAIYGICFSVFSFFGSVLAFLIKYFRK